MDTSKMNRFEEWSVEKLGELVNKSDALYQFSDYVRKSMDEAYLRTLINEIASNYEIGPVTEVYEIFGGYVNRSFGIYTIKEGQKKEYFVRLYKKGVTEKEINFEHSLITYAKENGLEMAAGIIKTVSGENFVKKDTQTGELYFAIYEFLPGEDKYTWIENELTDKEYASAAEIMAKLHDSTRTFDPKGLERTEPKIMELMPTLVDVFKNYTTMNKGTKFDEYYLKHFDSIIKVIEKTKIPSDELAQMPQNPIHCDFHPGNLKYVDEKVVGIFDFDWSKIDLRTFELGLALVYCCSSWDDELDGTLKLEQSKIFLQSYQKTLKELNGLAPLNDVEKKNLPVMLAAGNMYLIFWCLRDYYTKTDMNCFEYLTYLRHQVKLMNWIENNWDEILRAADQID